MARKRPKVPEGPRKSIYIKDGFLGPFIESPADDLVTAAWDAEDPDERVALASQAVELDLDALDAYNILGVHAATHGERLALFREAARIGDRLFAPLLDDKTVETEDIGRFIGTWPWLRAQQNLGTALIVAGDTAETYEVLTRVLTMGPQESREIRMTLLVFLAAVGDDDHMRIVLADCPPAENDYIEMAMSRLLLACTSRRKMNFPDIFEEIEDLNPHLLPMMVTAAKDGTWPDMPELPDLDDDDDDLDDFDLEVQGTPEEAALCLLQFQPGWTHTPKLLANFLQAHAAYLKTRDNIQ